MIAKVYKPYILLSTEDSKSIIDRALLMIAKVLQTSLYGLHSAIY